MTNEELQALCDAATPGPWDAKNIPFKIDDIPHDYWDVYYNRDNDGLWFGVADNYDEPTAKFVAAARTAIPELLAENARLARELNDATNRIETQMHQLNDAQRESVSLGLRLETAERDQRLLVQLWNAMAHTEQGWRVFVDGDLLREFEQAVLNE